MKNLSTLFLITFLLQACTNKDRYPNMLTLEKLIENREVIFIEKKDSISLLPFITFLNDSMYVTQKQRYIHSETRNIDSDEKMVTDVLIKSDFELKNIFNGKVYISESIDSKSNVTVNEKNDIMIDDIMFLAPDYTLKRAAENAIARKITDIKIDEKLRKLDEFDERVIYKWTNNGRLGTMHEMFYYQLGGKKFKSGSACYLITENGNYFYNDRLGVLKFK